jgi:hypothetical protein
MTGQKLSGHGFSRAGDQSFWGIGIPSVFMSVSEISAELGRKDSSLRTIDIFGPSPSGFGWWWHTPYDTVDKIDPDNLRRDAGVYALVTLALCTDLVLPLNYKRTVQELREILAEKQKIAEGTMDLRPLIEQTDRLTAALAKLNRKVMRLKKRQQAETANDGLMRLGRILIPMMYTRSGRFKHDAAVPIPYVPCLEGMGMLAKLDKNSDDFKFLRHGLKRDLNQIVDALNRALEVIEGTIYNMK